MAARGRLTDEGDGVRQKVEQYPPLLPSPQTAPNKAPNKALDKAFGL